MSNYIKLFNKNLESLLTNILDNFSEMEQNIKSTYSFPIEGESYLTYFITQNKKKGTDIANKNEIIFSKESIIIENIDFNYIWNDNHITKENKNIIWKYIQSLYLYSLEHTENIGFKNILQNYNKTNTIHNDTERIVVNIFNNLSNKKQDTSEESLVETENNDTNPFSMPDLSLFLGKHLMRFINTIVQKINIDEIELNNPLELVQLLLSGEFDLQNDSSGISSLVKKIISTLKAELLSESLDKKGLFKDIENVLSLINNITKSSFDFKNIIPDINDEQFNDNFNKIINSIDFDSMLMVMVEKLREIKENTNIDIIPLFQEIMNDYTNNKLDMSSLIGKLMKLVSSIQSNQSNTPNESTDETNTSTNTSNHLEDAFKQFGSLDLSSVIGNVMSELNQNTEQHENQNNIDLQSIIQSVTKNLPAELTNNMPKDLSNQLGNSLGNHFGENMDLESMASTLSNLLNGSNMDEIKNMLPSSKNTRINTNKITQLSKLEKRRERLRQKLEKRKQALNLK
tara:strand:+ start:1182 stop:2723 length:1542 start_codon:yes stop_codon:yes gene_type:complete